MRCVGYRQAWERWMQAAAPSTPLNCLLRARHCRHAPAGQAPDHLAAQHAAAPRHRLRPAHAVAHLVQAVLQRLEHAHAMSAAAR
jgi:hypothetical protein